MPTYVYRREDGTTFEVQQRITEEPLTADPETGQPVRRVISGAGLIFKGSGFYLTDYARNGNNGAKKEGDAGETALYAARDERVPRLAGLHRADPIGAHHLVVLVFEDVAVHH